MKRVESGDKYRSVSTVELHHDQPSSNAVKVRIPVKEYPAVSYASISENSNQKNLLKKKKT